MTSNHPTHSLSALSSAVASTAATAGLSRRTLIGAAAAAGVALAFGGPALLGTSNAFAAAAASQDFLRLSEFLTGGQPLTAALAARYQEALGRHEPQFAAAAARLQRHVADGRFTHVDELLAAPGLDPALRATATQIVSAWYLGIVGEDADAELISYANALMYRPTAGILDVPTYGSGPDSWGHKPPVSTVPNPTGGDAQHPTKKSP